MATHVWPGYELLYLAREQGYYDDRQIRLVELTSATETASALRTGAVEAGALTLDEALSLLDSGVEVRIVSLKPPSETLVQSDAKGLLDRVIYPVSGGLNAWRVLNACLMHPLRELGTLIELARHLGGRPESFAKSLIVWWRTLGLADEVRASAPQHLQRALGDLPIHLGDVDGATPRPAVLLHLARARHLPGGPAIGPKRARSRFAVTISDFNRRFLARERDCVPERRGMGSSVQLAVQTAFNAILAAILAPLVWGWCL